ncbi:lactoylglutathione lyase [Bacillus pakistanensis]|uniref:Lactoylglutathione lyase n=1 Tax=Rossellomorea pakistanensis TaxID=992288 RepID=A0ABS2NBM7_9BACI|nr:lactoylglutathione lyase [Bacillus pakistanensis]
MKIKSHHIGIEVQNLEKSVEFYESIFNFKTVACFILENEKIVFLENNGVKVELIHSDSITTPTSTVHFSWEVDHLETMIETLSMHSLHPFEGPILLDNGWITVFYKGLDSEIIEIIQSSL